MNILELLNDPSFGDDLQRLVRNAADALEPVSYPPEPVPPQTIKFAEDIGDMPLNPGRGWYGENRTIDNMDIQLDDYLDGPLPSAVLENVGQRLASAGIQQQIVRAKYNDDSGGTDAPLEVMLGHIEQLGPVLTDHQQHIYVYQAGYIGAWGEWHSSIHGHQGDPETRRAVAGAMLDSFPGMVSLRRPTWHQELQDLGGFERLTVHDDCILCSATDAGTWPNAEDEDYWRNYIRENCTPFGGEISRLAYTNESMLTGEHALRIFEQMGLTYANENWNKAVHDGWISEEHAEISKRMGYRIVLRDLTLEGRRLRVGVANTGFAAPATPHTWVLSLGNGAAGFALPGLRVSTLEPGEHVLEDDLTVPPGTYDIRLSITAPGQLPIRCANTGIWEDGRHTLGRIDVS